MKCPTCGSEAEQFIRNTVIWTDECQRCSFGPDRWCLRVVEVVTDFSFEIHYVEAPNNLDAFLMVVGDRLHEVKELFAMPVEED